MTDVTVMPATGSVSPASDDALYGIRFEDDGCSAEEQRLDVIKRQIFEKLVARLGRKQSAAAPKTGR